MCRAQEAVVLDEDAARNAEPGARFKDLMGLRYADAAEKISIQDAERLVIQTTEAATGFEFFMERELISPIVKNLADAGYTVEPNFLRDYIALKGDLAREELPARAGKTAGTGSCITGGCSTHSVSTQDSRGFGVSVRPKYECTTFKVDRKHMMWGFFSCAYRYA